MPRPSGAPVAFLFLGETLLIPHLYPIVEALAADAPNLPIDCWVATSVHEGLIGGWLAEAGLKERVRVRRVPGFLSLPELKRGENPALPPKIPTLLRLLPHLMRARLIVCAEQTSLWLPRMLPFLRRRFIKTSHGVGSMSARDDARRRAAYRMLVPSQREKDTYLVRGFGDEQVVVTGYVKAGFRALAEPRRLFADDRPVVVYAPHWQRHRSSWWAWGREIVAMLGGQERFNVILAPHQRLVEKAPDVRDVLAGVAALPHVHVDTDSFSMVDGTYMAAADIYLGDTSSQVVEFLMRPRPCVFLNPDKLDWQATDDHGFWECGEVIDELSQLMAALERAPDEHGRYKELQRSFAADALGDASPAAAHRAAAAIIAAL
ncbi:MAG TPA: hypothetical protein VIL42_01170 [Sphingomicrobium sp.]|jgi:hypothetical protein